MNLFKVYGTRQRNVSECVWVTAFTDLVTFIEKKCIMEKFCLVDVVWVFAKCFASSFNKPFYI